MTQEERDAMDAAWAAGATQRALEKAERERRAAYEAEADPLFFKAQRGEVTQQEWLDKVVEIKQRYPKPE
jgi:hypothetical protein